MEGIHIDTVSLLLTNLENEVYSQIFSWFPGVFIIIYLGPHLYRTSGIKSKEGERCSKMVGPFCEESLSCIGKIQFVDGLGTCRRIGKSNTWIVLL